ncbi:hypothetical protein DFH09DRAFT_1468413 [Mycena vulgaris]|nr:hypothetical protein DFH09DRAFT_1468413 [Mycena vulgaris]
MESIFDPAVLTHYWGSVHRALYTAMTGLFLYGIFLVLCVLGTYLLWCRPTTPGRMYFIAVTGAMLLFSTTQVVLHTAIAFFSLRLLQQEIAGEPFMQTVFICKHLFFAQDLLLVTNNLLADAVFQTYRCYLVWDKNVYVPILPLCMLAATTAGRIWWARQEIRVVLTKPRIVRKYNTAIAMMLHLLLNRDSGSSFRIFLPSVPVSQIFRGAIPLVVNIAPTLIIVRVGLRQQRLAKRQTH